MWIKSLCLSLSIPMRILVAVLSALMVIGPALFIAGLVILTGDNARTKGIKEFNAAGKSFAAGDATTMVTTAGTIGSGGTLSSVSQNVQVVGNQNGIETVNSVHLQGSSSSRTSYSLTFTQGGRSMGSLNGDVASTTKTATRNIVCGDQDCIGSSSNCACSSTTMRSKCTGSYTGNAGACQKGAVCGSCVETTYLSEACFVVVRSGNGWGQSSLAACRYPFTNAAHTYSTSSSSSVTVRVRAESDPYIILQRLTQGTEDFGLSQDNQIAIGTPLVGIGAAFFLIAGGVTFVILWRASITRNLDKTATAGPAEPTRDEEDGDAAGEPGDSHSPVDTKTSDGKTESRPTTEV